MYVEMNRQVDNTTENNINKQFDQKEFYVTNFTSTSLCSTYAFANLTA